VPPTT